MHGTRRLRGAGSKLRGGFFFSCRRFSWTARHTTNRQTKKPRSSSRRSPRRWRRRRRQFRRGPRRGTGPRRLATPSGALKSLLNVSKMRLNVSRMKLGHRKSGQPEAAWPPAPSASRCSRLLRTPRTPPSCLFLEKVSVSYGQSVCGMW